MRTPALLLLLASASVAAAAPPSWYRPDHVVAASKTFQDHAAAAQATVGPLEEKLAAEDRAMQQMDRSVALLRGAIPEAEQELWLARANERARTLRAEFERLQTRMDEQGLAYEAAFAVALERARQTLAKSGGSLPTLCEQPSGLAALSAGGPGGSASGACAGDDQSAKIAAAWDADTTLKSRLSEVSSKPWPTLQTYSDPLSPAPMAGGGGPDWIDPARLAESVEGAAEALENVDERATGLRARIQQRRREIGESIDEATVELIRDRARRVRAFSESAQQGVGKALWASLDRARKGGKYPTLATVAACPNPKHWGACPGTDRTDEAIVALAADRKLRKELDAVIEALVEPDVGF